MSVTINLLPWREIRRERRTRQIHWLMVSMLIVGAALGFGVAHHYQVAVKAQEVRNQYIRQETARLDKAISDVRSYAEQIAQINEQLGLFRALQEERLQTVRLFNAVAESVAQGVVYQRLSRSGDEVSVTAWASSDRQISAQLKRIAQLAGLGVPRFAEVESESESVRELRFRVQQDRAGESGIAKVPGNGHQEDGS